ncbi:hypothetical protein [Nocardioides terrigena]|uniref:hypothetical protein n=1 Tax=Nocardioides terrigena TaxID=424797 RepID=UPI000D32074A|nr:hypothetical protein [Nocardioides terrigena]
MRIGGIELSQVASTDPVGFAGEHVVLALTCEDAEDSAIGVDTTKLEGQLARVERLALSDRAAVAEFFADTRRFIDSFVVASRGQGNGSSTERRLFTELLELRRLLASASPGLRQTAVLAAIRDVRRTIRAGTRTDDFTSLVCEFNREVLAELAPTLGEIATDDDVALPSPAIFMEPVLSHAKGAELYDLRRNSHYELLTAPGIGDVDPNVVRARELELTPTDPARTLELLRPPELALPDSLGAALAEAGRLDLSSLISSSATSLTSTISTVADLATELARASTQLTGDAQEQALDAATEVAGKVAETLRATAAAPPVGPAPPAAPPTPVPAPPPAATTSQDQAPRVREMDRIDRDTTLTPTQRTERKQTLGVPVVPDPQLTSSISVQFLDDLGVPITGQYQASVEGFSQDPNDDLLLSGSVPLDVSDGILRIPGTFRLTPGRGVQLEVDARFGSATVPGVVQFRVPATPDLVVQCRMPVRTETVVETSVKRAVDRVVATSGVGTLFEEFMSSQVSLPFRLVELTGTDSAETSLDLKREYDASPSSTSEESGAPSQRTFRVTTPFGRWAITLFGA